MSPATAAMFAKPQLASPLAVLDVSEWQARVQWLELKRKAHVAAVYVRASLGETRDDHRIGQHRRGAEAAGVPLGLYHYATPHAHPGRAGAELEAKHFVRVAKRGAEELLPVLDMEDPDVRPGPVLVEWARAFNHVVHAELGVFPLFYSNPWYIGAMRPTKPIGTGLWLASYGRNDGRDHGAAVPKPWRHYLLHQFSSRCRVQGCAGLVDLSHAPYGLKPLLIATHRHRKG